MGRSFHWVPFAKESVWLGLEERVGGQLALGGELFAEGMRYTTRMYNLSM